MEDQRLSKVSSEEHHLPEELCRDILSRLPVKSLLRFRCVSKSWLSLINDPDFCSVHLKKFKNNCDETHLLVVEGKPKYCVVKCSNTFETNREILVTLPPSYRQVNWRIKCSVNGLVLLVMSYVGDDPARANDLMLWNPSIRKFHFIPSLPQIETSLDGSFQEAEIGIYYDPDVKDYKLVKLIRANPNVPPLVAIYTLGADSWKISQFQSQEFSDFVWDLESIRDEVVCLQGSLYFIAMNPERGVLELVAFDLSCEEFCSISIPESEQNWITLFCNGCSTLTLFYIEDGEVLMWVLEIDSMCWTKPYSFEHLKQPDRFLYLKKNRDILMWWGESLAEFCLATSDKFEQWCQLVTSYNLESKREKVVMLLQKMDDEFEICKVYGYIESLVLLK